MRGQLAGWLDAPDNSPIYWLVPDTDEPVVVTEFMEHGSLQDVIDHIACKNCPKWWTPGRVACTFYSVATAMLLLHKVDVMQTREHYV